MRLTATAAMLALVLAACGGSSDGNGSSNRPDLPETSAAEFEQHLAAIERPAVVNVWASWCLPCRSEAPLLNTAFEEYGTEIEFIGVDVNDNQDDAKAFLD